MTTEERIAILAEHAAGVIEDGMTVGLGSGSTAEAVVRALGKRVAGGLRVTGVATSSTTERLATSSGITLCALDDVAGLDLGIDGADEIDPHLNLVKGRGGALLWEKLVAQACERFIVVSSFEKLVQQLGTRMPLPVEVIPYGCKQTIRRIEALGCTAKLRLVAGSDEPYRTDGGHVIVDCTTGAIAEPSSFAYALKAITGVVDHGLFIDLATSAMIVDEAGHVRELTATANNPD